MVTDLFSNQRRLMLTRRLSVAALAGMLALTGAGSVDAKTVSAPPSAPSACAKATAVDPLTLYGDELTFEVRRNDRPVGTHTVQFSRNGDTLTTLTRFDVKVDVLFFTAYRYVYQSRAVWRDGCLQSLTAVTDDNGEKVTVTVERRGDRLLVDGPRGAVFAGESTLPTEHWNARVVDDRAVINTITGRVNTVSLASEGVEQVRIKGGATVPARRFAYRGELNNEVWYDGDGRWVKMRFPGTDGSSIDYLCVSCGQDATAESRS